VHAQPPGDPVYGALHAFATALVAAGVQHVCVAPGARSTPLALTFARHPGLRAWSHVDERAAAFFALGIAKTTGRVAVVVCTSGTAAANFYPAVVEAAYGHVPLLVLTADRPPELRDCGAPQTIDQIKLFGSHVKWFVEVAAGETRPRYMRALAARAVRAASARPPGPVHLNLPYREPLLPSEDRGAAPADNVSGGIVVDEAEQVPAAGVITSLAHLVSLHPHGLIVCGPWAADNDAATALTVLARAAGYPILADPLSQVRAGTHERSLVVDYYDALLRDETFVGSMRPQVVLRVGASPRSKPLLQYLGRDAGTAQVLLSPHGTWADPELLADRVFVGDPTPLFRAVAARLPARDDASPWAAAWIAANTRARAVIAERLRAMPELFEGKVFAELAELMPDGALLYVGNSMPVRDLEAFWPSGPLRARFLCNHGANGIDGLLSSGLGAAAVVTGRVVMVTGDLGFYHDMNGLLAAKRYGLDALIVVLNNDGGGIFSFLPQATCGPEFEEFFATPHGLDFRHAAELYQARFSRVQSWPEFRSAVRAGVTEPGLHIVEVPTGDRSHNVDLHGVLWSAVSDALRSP
jgi:2-succinyl-5-enolpyruvyl-6-hydroxy-3-cyclohexene-1-carboxylate synthase